MKVPDWDVDQSTAEACQYSGPSGCNRYTLTSALSSRPLAVSDTISHGISGSKVIEPALRDLKCIDERSDTMSAAKGPVIVITGTPGTGKTTHAQLLASESPVPLKHINVGELVKEKNLYEEYDEEWQSYTVDEDKVGFKDISWLLQTHENWTVA